MSTYRTAVWLGTAAPEALRRRFPRHHMPPPTSTARLALGTARRTSLLCRSLRLRDLRRELHEGRNVVAHGQSAHACSLLGPGGESATKRREEQAGAMRALPLLPNALVSIQTRRRPRVRSEPAWATRLSVAALRALPPLR